VSSDVGTSKRLILPVGHPVSAQNRASARPLCQTKDSRQSVSLWGDPATPGSDYNRKVQKITDV
ncbi:6945_t:CDS:2, partial [Acaulospora morrowiae]